MKTVISDELGAAESEYIYELLNEYGLTKGVEWHPQPLNIFLRDNDDKLLGGLIAQTIAGWLRISRLAIATELRGRGYGRKLMWEAERTAVERGCHSAWVDTHDFQAPDFYEKLGYAAFGAIDDHPIGHKRIFYAKRLEAKDG
jgi:ribosomal protein S18 acetylase RimI-like enzyme